MKLTEIMKQIPLDELTGDVDMKERTNINVTAGRGAVVKRTGAFVAAAACAAVAVGGAVAYKKLSKSETDVGVSAADINSAPDKYSTVDTESAIYKENRELYKLIYADELRSGADFDTLMNRVDIFDSSEGCTFKLDGSDGEFRVIGTRNTGSVLRIDIAGDVSEGSHPDGEYCFDANNVTLWSFAEDGHAYNLGDNGSLYYQGYSEDGKKTVFSFSFTSASDQLFTKTANRDHILSFDLDYYSEGRSANPVKYTVNDVKFSITKHSFDYSIEPDVTIQLSASSPYPDAKITLESVEYSDLGLRAVFDSEWGGEKLDSVWIRSGAVGVSDINSSVAFLSAEVNGATVPFVSGFGNDYYPWDVEDSEDGKMILVCDLTDRPIDASKLSSISFGPVKTEIGGGSQNSDSFTDSQPEAEYDPERKKNFYRAMYGKDNYGLAVSYIQIAENIDYPANGIIMSEDGQEFIDILGTRRVGNELYVDAFIQKKDLYSWLGGVEVAADAPLGSDISGSSGPLVTLKDTDGKINLGSVSVNKATEEFDRDDIWLVNVRFYADTDFGPMTVTFENIFSGNKKDAVISMPAHYSSAKGEYTYKLDGKLAVRHEAEGKETTCQLESITVSNGGIGIGIVQYPGSDSGTMIGISEIPGIFKSKDAPFCKIRFDDGTEKALDINTFSAPEALEDGKVRTTLWAVMIDEPINASKIERFVFSDGTYTTVDMLKAADENNHVPGTVDNDGYLVVDDHNRCTATLTCNAQFPAASKWYTQYKGEGKTARFNIDSVSITDGTLKIQISFLDDSCKYLSGDVDESGIDKARLSAAFYLPYSRSPEGEEFISIVSSDGNTYPIGTRIISKQHGDTDALTLTSLLSNKVPDENIIGIKIGTEKVFDLR